MIGSTLRTRPTVHLSGTSGLRGAIVGAGLMGRWHAHAIRRAGSRVIGVVDTNAQAAHVLAGRFDAPTFRRLDELLSVVQPEVLHICTPATTHAALVERAIEAGCHVLVEKPLVDDAPTTERLLQLAETRGVFLLPVHQYLFQDGVLRASRSLPSLGRLIHVHAVFCSAGAGEGGTVATLGDQVAEDILPHPLSLFDRFLPGSLETVVWSASRPSAGELRLHASDDQTTLSLVISMNGRPTRADLWLLGTSGSLHLDLFHGFSLREFGDVSRSRKAMRPLDLAARLGVTAAVNLARRALVQEYAYPGLDTLVSRLYRAIRAGEPPPISPASALAVARSREHILSVLHPPPLAPSTPELA